VKFLKTIIQKILSFFTSSKAQAALERAAELVPFALPIVKQIAALTPTRADDEIVAAFDKFAVPGAQQYLATPVAQRGYVLLQLATAALALQFPGLATNVLNTAVQLAVTGVKAS
jgi:hypothetical protein